MSYAERHPITAPARITPNLRRPAMRHDEYGDVFLSPESAIQAVLETSDWNDNEIEIDEPFDEMTDPDRGASE
jgi:hypothetical protein